MDLWIIHREEIETAKEGICNVYAILDSASKYCLTINTSIDLPSSSEIKKMIKEAIQKYGSSPKAMGILKSDPLVEKMEVTCDELQIPLSTLTYREIAPTVAEFSKSFKALKYDNQPPSRKKEDTSIEEIEAFIPKTYDPCPCASGSKYKFCCQKIFKEIGRAMCDAQDGNLEGALLNMKAAEEKVGRTAEVVSRYGIVWSFFDAMKSNKHFKEALELNPNHPRTNYVLGIEAAEKEKYRDAIRYYQKALEHYPSEDKFHQNETLVNLGFTFYHLNLFKEAKESWEKALVILPSDRMVIDNLINCIYQNPDVPEDVRELSPFIRKFLSRS